MQNLVKRTITLLSFTSVLGNISAQNTDLSLDAAIKKGLDNSKQLKISKAKVDAVKYKMEQSKNLLIPTVSLTAGYTRLSDNITPFVVNFPTGPVSLNPQILNQFANRASVMYNVFNGFKLKYSWESLQYLEKAIQLDAVKDEQEIKLNIISAYFNILRAKNMLSVTDSSIITLEKKIKDIENLKSNGMALENDVLKAKVALTTSQAFKLDVISALETSKYNFALMLGMNPTEAYELDANSVNEVRALETFESYIGTAEKKRSDIQAQEMRMQAGEKGIKQAKGGYFPTFAVGANYYLNRPNQRQFPPKDEFKNTWDVGATISWNLTSLYTTKAIAQEAKAVYMQNKFMYEMLSDNAKMEISANYHAFKTSIDKIQLLKTAVAQAAENKRVVNYKVTNNINLATDLIEAETQVLQSKVNLINAQIESQIAYFKLNKSIGQ